MADFSLFYPEVKTTAYGAPEPVIDVFLRRAAIDFCQKTRVYTLMTQEFAFKDDGRVEITGLDTDEEQYHAAVQVWYKGTPLIANSADRPVAVHEFAAGKFSKDAMRGTPCVAFDVPGERGVIGVYPIPAAREVDVFTMKIAMRPTDNCTVLPDVLVQDWYDAIVWGALSRLLAVRGQSYSDPQGAMAYKVQLAGKVLEARTVALTGSTLSGDPSVAMRPLA